MVLHRGDGHIGGALSMSDALAVLFGNYMKEEDWFVLSKGHAGPAYYAVLMLTGRLDQKHIHTLNENGTLLPSHLHVVHGAGLCALWGELGYLCSAISYETICFLCTARHGNRRNK